MPGKRDDRGKWLAEQRDKVFGYLTNTGIDHLGVGEVPAFEVFPHVSLWAVQSKVAPGRVGWWAFAGDGPTDIVSAAGARNPRAALRVLADQWADLADHMLQGQPHPSLKIGKPEEWPDLGRLLESRARTLREWADDNELWGADGELI